MYTQKISSGSTVKIFDKFFDQDDQMLIEDCIKINASNDKTYYLHLILDKGKQIKCRQYVSNPMAVSELKKCFKVRFNDPIADRNISELESKDLINISIPAYHFLLYFKNSLEKELSNRELHTQDIIMLNKPITIHAQTSGDMYYEWDGNQYGDTSTVYVAGYKIKWIL